MLRLVTVLTLGAATAAPAQLAITQPTEKLLVLPLAVTSPADSAVAVQAMDIARERLIQLARYKVLTVPKTKICEALSASGFACDILLAEQQASQLARSLSVNAYTTGTLGHNSASYTARIRISEGSSGFGMIFTVTGSTPAILGEAIGQRLNNIVRAAENARDCRDQRSRGAIPRALEAARKAIALEPNLPAAHLCMLSVYEVQRMPPDSMIAAARRALVGDSLNATAWNSIAQNYLTKGDTLRAMDAFYSLALTDLKNVGTVRGTAQLLLTNRQHQKCVQLAQAALKVTPGDSAIIAYQQAYRMDTTDVSTGLLVAKTIVDHAVLDTARLGDCTRRGDTTCRRIIGAEFASRLDPAWPYLAPGFGSRDSASRFAAAYIAYSGGSKLVQAGTFDRAFAWLEPPYTQLASDTIGPRGQLAALPSLYYSPA